MDASCASLLKISRGRPIHAAMRVQTLSYQAGSGWSAPIDPALDSEQTLVLADFPPGPTVTNLSFSTSRLTSPSGAGAVDQAWCGRVARWEQPLPTP